MSTQERIMQLLQDEHLTPPKIAQRLDIGTGAATSSLLRMLRNGIVNREPEMINGEKTKSFVYSLKSNLNISRFNYADLNRNKLTNAKWLPTLHAGRQTTRKGNSAC